MTQEEIENAVKFWEIEDEYYNFKTPKSTYAIYCMICFFEHRKLKTTRILNNKCEVKVISPRSWFKFALVSHKRLL